MTNFLISLRKFSVEGKPTYDVGPTTYIEIADGAADYNTSSVIPDKNKWLSDLSGKSVLVFVHGFDNDSAKVIIRHKLIKRYLPPGYALVSFDWPAQNPGITPRQVYERDKNNAKTTAPRLMSDCLQVLVPKFTSGNVHLFGHSMGAYLTEQAFQAAQAIKINHVLLAAADVDQLNYQAGSPPLTNFLGKCTDLTAYWSADDQALQESQSWQGYVPLGLGGYKGSAIPGACYGVECTPYFEQYAKGHPPPPPPVILPPEFSHVWYMFYQPPLPALNDFYTDANEVIQGSSTTPTRAKTTDPRGFKLQRPVKG
jgi:pimeloyl-ACP methyl ester carboxylesterase